MKEYRIRHIQDNNFSLVIPNMYGEDTILFTGSIESVLSYYLAIKEGLI